MSKPDQKETKQYIEGLAKILREQGLTEIEVDHGDVHIRIARDNMARDNMTGGVAAAPPDLSPVMETKQAPTPQQETAKEEPVKIAAGTITSPMVGTVYLAPEPGTDPFVAIGDQVKKGQTLLIIEAMKTMNHISATHGGTVKDILVADAQAVEFGQPLIVIK